MYIDSSNARISSLATHFVGNKYTDDKVYYSKEPVDVSAGELNEHLLSYFTTPFKDAVEFFEFWHESELTLNPVLQFVGRIFKKQSALLESSLSIAKHLFEITDSPNIKSGELHIAFLEHIIVDDKVVNAVGIYKTENRDNFFKINKYHESYRINLENGIRADKLDKGCLILDLNGDDNYTVCSVDSTNKRNEAQYWKEHFLKVKPVANEYHLTNNYLNVCKNFVLDQLEQEYEVTKTDKIGYLNKSVDFFKTNDTFNENTFLETVFEDPEVIKSFRNFREEYAAENDLSIDNGFEISDSAVKKQARVFKSVLKLDKNFHVYVHGDTQLIEKGYDAKRGKHFYKIYFDEET